MKSKRACARRPAPVAHAGEAAYEATPVVVDKWNLRMERRREAEHPSFPLQAPAAPPALRSLRALPHAPPRLLVATHLAHEGTQNTLLATEVARRSARVKRQGASRELRPTCTGILHATAAHSPLAALARLVDGFLRQAPQWRPTGKVQLLKQVPPQDDSRRAIRVGTLTHGPPQPAVLHCHVRETGGSLSSSLHISHIRTRLLRSNPAPLTTDRRPRCVLSRVSFTRASPSRRTFVCMAVFHVRRCFAYTLCGACGLRSPIPRMGGTSLRGRARLEEAEGKGRGSFQRARLRSTVRTRCDGGRSHRCDKAKNSVFRVGGKAADGVAYAQMRDDVRVAPFSSTRGRG
ncbi:hypothetical protein FB451DRAFT_1561772 [Mycena latifolia]|nr:hypothetical protein FB451DRAFT_1561772 [Mycena latifolia]